MERRKFLVGVGSASLGGSALLGTGAFSRVESNRAVTIQVAADPDAYLGLDECETLHGDNYVELDDNGHLYVDISENPNAGEGVNSNSRTWFHNVFQICNQGKEDACVWIERDDNWPVVESGPYEGDPRVDFYLEDDEEASILGAENATAVRLGECYCIGIRTNTHGINANDEAALLDDLEDTITLVADVECPDPDAPPECVEPKEATWDEIGERDEAGGPVIVMGLDSELAPGSDGHGPPEEHAEMVASLLDDVTNGQDGILVLGGNPTSYSNIIDYWEGDVGKDPQVDEDVDFVYEEDEMETVDFDNYAMLGVVSGDDQLGWGSGNGLTNSQNEVLIDRSDDIADFVNAGGGLLVKTQDGLDDPAGFLGPLGQFDGLFGIDGAGYGDAPDTIEITEAGEELGLDAGPDGSGMNNWESWCCWHDVYTEYPDFLEVLAWNTDSTSAGEGHAAALGGDQVLVPREVALSITGVNALGDGQSSSYKVELENQGGETIEGDFEIDVISGGVSIDHQLPDGELELGSGEGETWEDGLELTADGPGMLEIEVAFTDEDGVELVSVNMMVDSIPEDPGIC